MDTIIIMECASLEPTDGTEYLNIPYERSGLLFRLSQECGLLKIEELKEPELIGFYRVELPLLGASPLPEFKPSENGKK